MKFRIGLLIAIGIMIFGAVVYGMKKPSPSSDVTVSQITPTPSPFPFQELTIPYLRKKTYDSSLTRGDEYSKTATYTSYRASYTSDGFTIYGLLTIPNGETPEKGWPAIVFLHGYIPPTIYTTTGQYVAYVDYLARNGFVVFKPDYRGHDKSEGEARGAYNSSDYVIDALNAYDALSKFPGVNPKGIGLWGHSMSGNVAMRTFAVRPTIPAIVIWAGAVYTYSDQKEFGIQDGSYRPPPLNTQLQERRQKLRELYGDFSPDSWFWKQVAITDYVHDLKGSVQVHHAVDDTVVNIGYSRNLMKLLDGTSVPHQLFEYPDGGHNIQGASFTTAFERTVTFFKEMLK